MIPPVARCAQPSHEPTFYLRRPAAIDKGLAKWAWDGLPGMAIGRALLLGSADSFRWLSRGGGSKWVLREAENETWLKPSTIPGPTVPGTAGSPPSLLA